MSNITRILMRTVVIIIIIIIIAMIQITVMRIMMMTIVATISNQLDNGTEANNQTVITKEKNSAHFSGGKFTSLELAIFPEHSTWSFIR